mmetsp:Transcript_58640/g.143399  ORF Transcript_58640/g.143399 Transcript_58640/m.143399 type:complete len:190 (+) Transcript_58640:134-703(+)
MNPLDCDRPACDDIQDALKLARDRIKKNGNGGVGSDSASNGSSKGKARDSTAKIESGSSPTSSLPPSSSSLSSSSSCPPRSAELGRSSWTLLHSMAAWYPDDPTSQQQHRMANFMEALGDFYPCPWCADDFRTELHKTPPKVETRTDLCMWLCDQHNRVNSKLGKQLFDCNMKDLDERWRRSADPKCNR